MPKRIFNRLVALSISFTVSALFTVLFATILASFAIPITVIIPSSAPVWMGTLTIGYMVQMQ